MTRQRFSGAACTAGHLSVQAKRRKGLGGDYEAIVTSFREAPSRRSPMSFAAWRSRFGHPHPQVVARYADAGVPLWNTADAGSLAVSFPADGPPTPVQAERIRRPRYWRERPAPARP